MLGVAFWIARQDRPIGKKHYAKLTQQDEELGEQFNEIEKENQTHTRRLTQQDRRLEELTQKLRELEAEVAALKRPAT